MFFDDETIHIYHNKNILTWGLGVFIIADHIRKMYIVHAAINILNLYFYRHDVYVSLYLGQKT